MHMPREAARVRAVKRTTPARYRKLTVSWHTSVDGRFDPVASVTAVAKSLGLVVRVGKSKIPDRVNLRVDTVESSPVVTPEEREARRTAVKNFRKLLRSDPKLATKLLAALSSDQRQRITQQLEGNPPA
jgi:hypothetical protein